MPLPADLLALLNACRADPVSDLPRLVLADWLDEHDDPARAEFLRVQCELARPSLDTERIAALKLRERALIDANWRAWAGGLHEVCCDLIDAENRRDRGEFGNVRPVTRDDPLTQDLPWGFVRGLIALRTTPSEIGEFRVWAKGDELPWLDLLTTPFQSGDVSVSDPSWVLPRALKPYLGIDFDFTPYAEFDLTAFTHSRHWGQVRSLTIHSDGDNSDLDPALRTAFRQADYSRVRHLKFEHADHAYALFARPLPKLVSLDVGGTSLPPGTLLSYAKRTPRLNVLSAWRTPLGDQGFAALVASSWGETLHTLEVMNCYLGDDAMASLVNSGLLGRLYGPQLNLSMNRIADAGLATLADSEDLLRFGELILRENRVGDDGVEALAASPFAANLRYLDLWKNRLTDRGAVALARSPHLGQLRDLNVRDNALTDAGREVLTARYGAAAKVGF